MAFLEQHGYRTTLRTIQGKLNGYLAGLGVYGKSGLLIHPVLGNRMCLGVVMTDAEIEPDSPLEDFSPARPVVSALIYVLRVRLTGRRTIRVMEPGNMHNQTEGNNGKRLILLP